MKTAPRPTLLLLRIANLFRSAKRSRGNRSPLDSHKRVRYSNVQDPLVVVVVVVGSSPVDKMITPFGMVQTRHYWRSLCTGRRFIRGLSTISSAEAGRRAEAIALQRPKWALSKLATKASHAGIQHIPNAPLAPPIHVATTYVRPADGNYLETDSIYSRSDNPTRLLLEKSIFELETYGLSLDDSEGSSSHEMVEPTTWTFASGMMAVSAVVLAHSTPLTIILPHDLYHGVPTVMADVFSRHNVTVKRADMTDTNALLEEIAKADLDAEVIVWMESPSNPKCQVIDIAAVADAVRGVSTHTVTTVVDVTMASPVVTRPLEVS